MLYPLVDLPEHDQNTQRKGLLHMKMAEGAKLQMCYLLHHLCDVQLRHRVESLVAFSFDFVGDLQSVRVHICNKYMYTYVCTSMIDHFICLASLMCII